MLDKASGYDDAVYHGMKLLTIIIFILARMYQSAKWWCEIGEVTPVYIH